MVKIIITKNLELINKVSSFNLKKQTSLSSKYWITPQGEEINIGSKDAHGRWALNNAQLLKDKYGVDLSKLWPHDASNVAGMLIESFGWIRVTAGYETSANSDFAVELQDIHNIPSSLDNFIAKHYTGPRLEIDDVEGNFIIIDDPFPNIQKAVNLALRQQPVTASLNKHSDYTHAYWIAPDNKIFQVRGEEGNVGSDPKYGPIDTHGGWILKNWDMLKQNYGFTDKDSGTTRDLVEHGWIRIGDAFETDWGITIKSLKNIPTSVDNMLAKFAPEGSEITITTPDSYATAVTFEWPVKSIQQEVNRRLAFRQRSYNPSLAASLKPLSKKEAGFNPFEDESLKKGPPYAVYVFTQKGLPEYGIPDIEMFDIYGDHPRFGSTVGRKELEELGIPIRQDKKAQLHSDYDYSSAQFNLPKELSEKIIRWAVENIPEEDIVYDSVDKGTKGIQLDSHITLKYGLLTNEFSEIENALKGEKAPKVKFNKTSFFEPEGKDYDVVIIAVESENLHTLNKKLCDKVKHEDTQGPEYHPHTTVAYVKRGEGKKWEGKDIITGEEITLDKLTFSPKEGEAREMELFSNNTKESSFMPSNTDLAPSDDWAGTVGYPTNESMDAPQNKSDEETWYSPENDRPRNIQWWKKILNLFKPMSKKEVGKEADFDWRSATAFWLDPNGKMYRVRSDSNKLNTHVEWVYDNRSFLAVEYGINIDPKDFGRPEEHIFDYDKINAILINLGWIRVDGNSIQLKDILHIPTFVFDLKFMQNEYVTIEDLSHHSIQIIWEEANADGQKAINKALQQQRLAPAANKKETNLNKKAIIEGMWVDPSGNQYTVSAEGLTHGEWVAVNLDMLKTKYGLPVSNRMLQQSKRYFEALEEGTENVNFPDLGPVWDKMYAQGWIRIGDAEELHDIGITLQDSKRIPSFLDSVLAENISGEHKIIIEDMYGDVIFVDYPFKSLQQAVNKALQQKRMQQANLKKADENWYWADHIYNYVGDNWKDWLIGWLELDPKNYVKPAILIKEIGKDEGKISALVYVEFINTTGNSDAFIELDITGDIHYEPSYEPEGVETQEWLDDWQIEVLDYGKKQEKTSDYGPTNYKSPSTPDYDYQNSAWDKMNVTYSPEENDENVKQNGADGYPQRWFGRPKGKYYTKLPPIPQLSKNDKEAAIEQVEILDMRLHVLVNPTLDELLGLSRRVGHHDVRGLIDPNTGDLYAWSAYGATHKPMIDALGLSIDYNKIHYPGSLYILQFSGDTVVRMLDYQKEVRENLKQNIFQSNLKQADISGQVANNIIKLIQQTGGATYNLSKGNLVGQPMYAVAIYPDREQILEGGVDFDRIEQYLVQNEDLLSNPNNSFGAWTHENKIYLDVVAAVSDLNQAMELGQKHNQIAIFDLKNLQEIKVPGGRQANLKIASIPDNFWIAPDGKEFPTDHLAHMEWVEYFPKLLKEYGLPTKNFEKALKGDNIDLINDEGRFIFEQMIQTGWTRVSIDPVYHGIGIQVENVKNIPRYLDNFLIKYNETGPATIEDTNNSVEIDSSLPSVQKAVNMALSHKRLQPAAKQAAAVSDKQQQKYYDDVYSERWPDDSAPIDGGNEYNKGWSELGSNDYPNPKDLDKERALLDQLQKPVDRNYPPGLPEYQVTYYESEPAEGDHGGM